MINEKCGTQPALKAGTAVKTTGQTPLGKEAEITRGPKSLFLTDKHTKKLSRALLPFPEHWVMANNRLSRPVGDFDPNEFS
jgi:hypothetical protein